MLALTPDFFMHLIFYVFSGVAIASAVMVVITNNPVKGALFLVLAFVAMAAVWVMADAQFLGLILMVVYVGAVMTLFLFVVMMLKLDLQSLRRQLWHYLPIGLVVAVLVAGVLFMVIRAEKSLPVPHLSSEVRSQEAATGAFSSGATVPGLGTPTLPGRYTPQQNAPAHALASSASAEAVSGVSVSGVGVATTRSVQVAGSVGTPIKVQDSVMRSDAAPEGEGSLTLVNLGNALYGRDAYPVEIAAILLLAAIIAAIALAFRGPQERLGQETNEQVAVRREDYVRIVKMKSEKKQ